MKSNQSRPRIGACLGLSVLFLFLLAGAVSIISSLVTRQAELKFGSPSAQLTRMDRLYLSAILLLHSNDLTEPVNPSGGEVSLTVSEGESVPSITAQLSKADLITNQSAFNDYLQYTGMDTGLKAGDYVLSSSMSPVEIAQAMQISTSPNVTFSILPGWRVEEIANSLPTSGLNIEPEEFIQAAQSHPEGYSFSECLSNDSLEGFLFPSSYTLDRHAPVGELLQQVLTNYEAQVSSELRGGFSSQGLDLCQATTLASIIQREAVLEDEMPQIASVFYNRLRAGSVLASDPTVQFAIGFNPTQGTWWTNPLSQQDLQVDSPYNTYLYPGLPPGPISNPGLPALRAAAFPAETPYYYFRSACDGSGRHVFAVTFEEHKANACP